MKAKFLLLPASGKWSITAAWQGVEVGLSGTQYLRFTQKTNPRELILTENNNRKQTEKGLEQSQKLELEYSRELAIREENDDGSNVGPK